MKHAGINLFAMVHQSGDTAVFEPSCNLLHI